MSFIIHYALHNIYLLLVGKVESILVYFLLSSSIFLHILQRNKCKLKSFQWNWKSAFSTLIVSIISMWDESLGRNSYCTILNDGQYATSERNMTKNERIYRQGKKYEKKHFCCQIRKKSITLCRQLTTWNIKFSMY